MVDTMASKMSALSTQDQGELRKVVAIMSGTDKKVINWVAREFYEFAISHGAFCEQPIILPVEEAQLTTRKSPCGNGTATFSRYKLRVHQRLFKLSVYDREFASVVDFLKQLSVDVQLKIE